jgi:hypothetical protein
MIMIDKDRAERNAIMNGESLLVCLAEQFLISVLYSVWDGDVGTRLHLRVCQFHIVQAILRWMASTVRILQDVKVGIIQHFRLVQQCCDPFDDPWEESLETFEQSIANTYAEFKISPGNTQTVLQYFRDNWFCPEWRGACYECCRTVHKSMLTLHLTDLCTDIGLHRLVMACGTQITGSSQLSVHLTQ